MASYLHSFISLCYRIQSSATFLFQKLGHQAVSSKHWTITRSFAHGLIAIPNARNPPVNNGAYPNLAEATIEELAKGLDEGIFTSEQLVKVSRKNRSGF